MEKALICVLMSSAFKIRRPFLEFVGFELEHIGNMLDDEGAQRASATVASYGLHDYAKRDTPVYYYRRK